MLHYLFLTLCDPSLHPDFHTPLPRNKCPPFTVLLVKLFLFFEALSNVFPCMGSSWTSQGKRALSSPLGYFSRVRFPTWQWALVGRDWAYLSSCLQHLEKARSEWLASEMTAPILYSKRMIGISHLGFKNAPKPELRVSKRFRPEYSKVCQATDWKYICNTCTW